MENKDVSDKNVLKSFEDQEKITIKNPVENVIKKKDKG